MKSQPSRVTYEDLTPAERLKISILDSPGCAIGVIGAPPIAVCLAPASDFGVPNGRGTRIGFSHEVSGYPGFPTRPFTWEESSTKFDKLVTGREGVQLSQDTKDALRSLEKIEVSDLTERRREPD